MPIDRSTGRVLGVYSLVFGLLGATAVYVTNRLSPAAPSEHSADDQSWHLHYPGHYLPDAVPAAGAALADDEAVIGVMINGSARAYSVAALLGPANHVVNDLIDGKPVTVSYCDLQQCARVYSGPGSEPLDVGVAGYDHGLLLQVNGKTYRQDTGALVDGVPGSQAQRLQAMGFELTTWKAWRNAHPHTRVVVSIAGSRIRTR